MRSDVRPEKGDIGARDLYVREPPSDDPAMVRIREIWEAKREGGMTMQALGELMGYEPESARKSVSQFLRSRDCHVAMVRRFAKAVGVKPSTLIGD